MRGVEVELGLVVHAELVAGVERAAQVAEQDQLRRRVRVAVGLVDAHAAATGLRDVHRDVGALEQRLDVVGVVGQEREADRGLDVQHEAVDDVGLGERTEHALGEHRAVVDAAHRLEQDRELVTAEARHGVGLAHDLAQPVGDLDQQGVAAVVAERVVDLLEPVDVEQQQSDVVPLGLGVGDRPLEALGEQATVGQAGERVEQRQASVLRRRRAQPVAGVADGAEEQQPQHEQADTHHDPHVADGVGGGRLRGRVVEDDLRGAVRQVAVGVGEDGDVDVEHRLRRVGELRVVGARKVLTGRHLGHQRGRGPPLGDRLVQALGVRERVLRSDGGRGVGVEQHAAALAPQPDGQQGLVGLEVDVEELLGDRLEVLLAPLSRGDAVAQAAVGVRRGGADRLVERLLAHQLAHRGHQCDPEGRHRDEADHGEGRRERRASTHRDLPVVDARVRAASCPSSAPRAVP